jgi:hypothetical protein
MDNKLDELQKIAQPLVNFLRENYHPHCSIIVKVDAVKVVEDVMQVVYENE